MHILLDSFKIGANVITYNGFNPATWKNFAFNLVGRMLMSVNDGTRTIGFEYNYEGLRTKKIVGSLVKNYYYEGLKLLRESTPYYDIDFDFNEYDELIGFKYNNEQYYYVRDVLRNILGIVDTNGNLVVKYRYDAWGNHQVLDANGTVVTDASFIGNINPFRYKGYYYDVETQLFYCNSRYYSPELCRFISPDSIEYLDPTNINNLNLYAYCGNDPVNMYDPSGNSAILACLVTIAISGVITGISSAAGRLEGESAIGAFVGGFIDGAIGSIAVAAGLAVSGPGGILLAACIGAIGGALGNVTGQLISYGNVDGRAVFIQAFYSAITAGASTGILEATKLFPKTGNFKRDFVNNLRFYASEDVIYKAGPGIISSSVTGFLAYLSLPSANTIRKY